MNLIKPLAAYESLTQPKKKQFGQSHKYKKWANERYFILNFNCRLQAQLADI